MSKRCRIGVIAPASRMSAEVAEKLPALAARRYLDRTPEIVFHPQCFATHGHFAGDDETRAQAFLDVANDESYDAVWFARGGYGSCRMVEDRKSTRLNSSHSSISYAVFCLKKKKKKQVG